VPRVIIIAGPNGAGKTTFASEYLSEEEKGYQFVNADEISRAIAGNQGEQPDLPAARMMLKRIGEMLTTNADFVVESTLSGLGYAQKIPAWRKLGYAVTLIYLRLPSVDASLARVRKRVAAGGHDIPADAIRRRFNKSLTYFDNVYKPIVDVWYLYESQEGGFVLLDSWSRA
jgi:predicted ABC-type ATPase